MKLVAHAKIVLLVRLQMMTVSPATLKYLVLMIAQALIMEIVIQKQEHAIVRLDLLLKTVQVSLVS